MTTEIDDFQTSLVAAVQAELERHASAVVAEVDRLRDEGRRERAELRDDLTAQVNRLAEAAAANSAAEQVAELEQRFEAKLTEVEQRQTRRIDDVTSSIEGLVIEATRPVVNDLRSDHEALTVRTDALDANLRKFDEQAARMVTYFNDVSTEIEQRQSAHAEEIEGRMTSQLDELKRLVDENDSVVRKFQTEVQQSVTQKLNDSEDRLNNRVLASENRIKEENGQKIAEIELHVSRVSGNLDDSLGVLNDRIAAVDDRFIELGREIEQVAESIKDLDQEALEELKGRMEAAAGEAMLVRIEMERLEQGINERTDSLTTRMTEVETQLQDQTMDVSVAIQLDRLEELERAMAELDPDQFVRRDGPDPTISTGGESGGMSPTEHESVENRGPAADASSGPDIAAIIAAAEGRPSEPEHQD